MMKGLLIFAKLWLGIGVEVVFWHGRSGLFAWHDVMQTGSVRCFTCASLKGLLIPCKAMAWH
jgi:hypothetical protein